MIARLLSAALLALGLLAAGAVPADVRLNEDVPETYVVRRGDTLWGISGMYLREPWRWPELWQVNPQIDNPHLIYPGDRLRLQWVNGEPRLMLQRGGEVKLSPGMRVEPLDLAIPLIPLDEVGPFLLRHRILNQEQIESSAYVVAGAQGHLISAPGDRIYGRGPFPPEERAYGIYRPGAAYRDPLTEELLGYQGQDIGNAQLLSASREDVKELEINRVTEEVRIGDRLMPMQERIVDATFHPRAPEAEIEGGLMIAVDGGVSQIGTWDIVVINKGLRDGLEVGHVLAIYQAGELVRDEVAGGNVQLPDARAGLAMVFEVYDRASYALVLKANRPLRILDKVKNP